MSLETILSTHTHMHTHTHTHTHRGTSTHKHSDYTKLNIHSLKQEENTRETWNESRCMEQKTRQVYNFGKRNVFRFDLNESRVGFGRVTETPSLAPRFSANLLLQTRIQQAVADDWYFQQQEDLE